jgi:hypothetical protein
MEIGQIVTKENYTKTAIECNKLGDRHIELIDGQYVIVANPAPTEPTLEEQVAKLEAETGLTRIMREGILAEGSLYSDYAKAKAQEIEDLASQLRTCKEDLQVKEGW